MQLAEERIVRAAQGPPRVPASGRSAPSLANVIVDLRQLNHDTEQDFLKIGGKLTEFMQAVTSISSDLGTLAESGSGDRVSRALTQAVDSATAMRSPSGDGNRDLTDMRTQAGLLRRTLNGFERTVSTFHTLALMTRIETARIGGEGGDFKSVADDVSGLAGQIQDRVGTAMTIADSLIPSIERATREISALETTQAEVLPALVSRSLASLVSIGDIQNKAHESSVRLKSQYGAISNSFNKLIVSMQFHDITRQQVEHVIEVIERLSNQCERYDCAISGYPRGMSAVLALQSAQLADAASKFATSVLAVERSLEEIATHVVEMSRESRALSGMEEGGKQSIFLSMEQDFRAILVSLDKSANTGSATQVARQSLGEIIGEMNEPIHEIQKIELEMRRIALNAQISACNLGSAGVALDVLAGSVQQLASECRERSESLNSASWAVTGESANRESGSSAGTRAIDGTMEDLRLAVEDMHSSSQRGFALIQRIVAGGDSLAGELAATRIGFKAGFLFAKAIDRVQEAIGKVQEKVESSRPPDDRDEPKTMFADLAGQYTMQAERDVHDAIDRANKGSVQKAAPAEAGATSAEDGSELEGNVEFF